jgi:putative ABC transport system substrate-binding protein
MLARAITSLGLAVLIGSAPFAGNAQQLRRVTIGWLGSGSLDTARQEAFEHGLRQHGLEARLETRFAQAKLDRLPDLAAALVRLSPELILVSDAVSTAALKKATSSVPIVMAGASDPVGLGLVQSLAQPGGNVTGLSSPFGDEFARKWVELLRDVRPGAKRVATIWNPEIPAARRRHAQVRHAAAALGLSLTSLEVRQTGDFERAFARYKETEPAGLIVDNAPFITANASTILEFATAARVATVWGHAAPVRAGGLLSYGADYRDIYRKAAGYAAKIIQGAKPGDLPVEQPTKYELVINLRTAKALGLALPSSVLIRADDTIQ